MTSRSTLCNGSETLAADLATSAARAWFGPLALMLVVICSTTGMLLTVGTGTPGTLVVAVYPPTWDRARSVAATAKAGGPIVALGPFDWIVVTVSEDDHAPEDLRRAGAVLLLNRAAARLCDA